MSNPAAARVIANTLTGFDYDVPDDADAMADAEAIIDDLATAGWVVLPLPQPEPKTAGGLVQPFGAP